jgi:hypothetical protein
MICADKAGQQHHLAKLVNKQDQEAFLHEKTKMNSFVIPASQSSSQRLTLGTIWIVPMSSS